VGSLRTLYDTRECPCALFYSTKTLLLWMRGSMLLGFLSMSDGSSISSSHWRIRNLSCVMLYPDWTPKRNSSSVMFSICTALLIGYTNEVVPWMFPAPDSLKNAERLKAVKCNFYINNYHICIDSFHIFILDAYVRYLNGRELQRTPRALGAFADMDIETHQRVASVQLHQRVASVQLHIYIYNPP
jgi:hypothetical protein